MKYVIFAIIVTLSLNYGAAKNYEYAEISVKTSEDTGRLAGMGIDIDRSSLGPGGSMIDGKVTVYVTEEQFSEIAAAGFEAEWRPIIAEKAGYRYNEAIGDSMLIWQNRYPDICKRLQIGTSVQGRPMWMLKITDNIDVEEAEPEVKFVGTIHGDEVTGLEMQMFLIENILRGYAAENDTMKFIVDNTELYVMPLMNPDGMANVTRYNANGYDLNRNFPEGTHYDPDSVNSRLMPEIQAVIDFTSEHDFVMSTNYHGGALVANYLYDIDFGVPNYSYADCPDDPHVTWIAYNYSKRNPPMFASPYFSDGITNGSVWYQITGGMQDWNYRYHNCLDITLEISSTKWPSYTSIPGFWEDNREAMMWYLLAAHKGIYGTVTDSVTGDPLNATIEIEGIDKQYNTDPDHGDYYRILKPGTYTMTVSAENYFPQTVDNIVVTDDTGVFKEAAEVNVQMVSCVGINDDDPIAEDTALEQNYPNPFNPETLIAFTLDSSTDISLMLYDMNGNRVAQIAKGRYGSGRHEIKFSADGLPSGVYTYILKGKGGSEISKKMLIVK